MKTGAVLSALVAAALMMAGCEAMLYPGPAMPQKEYEKLIVGRFDADYVGTNNCLSTCHSHDRIRRDFEASTMGVQMSRATGMPVVDCESCHGPGSLAISNITPEGVLAAQSRGEELACDHNTLIDIKNLPSPARSLVCLKCHTANATFNLHAWNGGAHAASDVSCDDCHNVHAGPDMIVRPRETYRMCLGCHEEQEAEIHLPSHHPVLEQKVMCIDCHDPHGTFTANLLRKDTVRATCTACHAEKEGPFVFEHADMAEDCISCHVPHGSINADLLSEGMPFLCLQCHDGHWSSTTEETSAYYTRCTDCHSSIHGSDVPSYDGTGKLLQ